MSTFLCIGMRVLYIYIYIYECLRIVCVSVRKSCLLICVYMSLSVKAAVTEYYRLGNLKTIIYILHFWRLRSPSSRCRRIQCLVRPLSSSSLMAVFSLCSRMVEGTRGLSGASLIRPLTTFMRAPPL